jgi:hypothetical protein
MCRVLIPLLLDARRTPAGPPAMRRPTAAPVIPSEANPDDVLNIHRTRKPATGEAALDKRGEGR